MVSSFWQAERVSRVQTESTWVWPLSLIHIYAATKCIDDIVFVPEIGKLYYGRVVRLMTFGAFVELAPGKDGLVHISKLADHRIEKVEDACKVGDMMWVKVTDIDEKGRVNLSHKDAMKEIRAKEAAGERVK